ncbi:RluA family pseudouridine synthase [Helcococcus bovis]|uniref:RluA family pseudouridine synthase n=1 Tax=Helcococcus bovis TaxID=3153252 RepID=UPI0038BA2118
MRNIKIDINDDNQTLIKFLNKYFSEAPNSLIYKWLRTKKIKVNKKKSEPSTLIFKDDIIDIYIYDEEIEKWQKDKVSVRNKLNLEIAFENEDIIIIDKPQNVLVHAANKEDYGKNVVDFIVDYLIEKKEYIPRLEPTFRPSVANRIDRNTMGLVIGAKTRKSLLELNNSIDNYIHKYYLAIVHGKIAKKIEIKNKLEKNENNYVSVSDTGKESITIISPLQYNDKYSLVEIKLLTGRTHQIRATLSNIGHPIIGDRRYGIKENSKLYKDQQLVAYKIKFDKKIKIESLRDLVIESKYKKYIYNLFKKLN